MKRKSLKMLFEEIDYPNKVAEFEREGYKILDQYMNRLTKNIIEDEREIRKLLARFLFDIQVYGEFEFDQRPEINQTTYYDLSIILLQKIYPPKDDPLQHGNIPRDKYHPPKFSYKTEFEVIDLIQTGREGGIYHILKTLVVLSAERRGEIWIKLFVVEYLHDISQEEKMEISSEYRNNFGEHLSHKQKEMSLQFFARLYLERVLEEHPKMQHRMRSSLQHRDKK